MAFVELISHYLLVLAMEPRMITRWDVHKYARRAYDMGVRYIGGCCGFHPYHIRAIAEEVGPVKEGCIQNPNNLINVKRPFKPTQVDGDFRSP